VPQSRAAAAGLAPCDVTQAECRGSPAAAAAAARRRSATGSAPAAAVTVTVAAVVTARYWVLNRGFVTVTVTVTE
jgi:hypothetical protein